MQVIRAKTAGFCMGVDLALRKLEKLMLAGSDRPIYTLGPIIHNPQVLKEYEERGVKCERESKDIPPESNVVIRAHGIPRAVESELKSRQVRIVDATCPKVKKAQVLIAEQTNLGGRMLLFGEDDHPEVKGLLSYANPNSLVFETLEELQALSFFADEPLFLAAQTTQDRKGFGEIILYLRKRLGRELPVLHTICDATMERQAEAVAIARQAPAMVVVGGFESGNTRRLAHVVEAQGAFCAHVEIAEQLPLEKLGAYPLLGLTAGASTPKKVIDAIEERLKQL